MGSKIIIYFVFVIITIGIISGIILSTKNSQQMPQQYLRPSSSPSVKQQPIINQIIPDRASVNTEIIIIGSGFTATSNSIKLTLNNAVGFINDLNSSDSTRLSFFVPDGLNLCSPESIANKKQCPGGYPRTQPGIYSISVTNNNGQSNVVEFEIQ